MGNKTDFVADIGKEIVGHANGTQLNAIIFAVFTIGMLWVVKNNRMRSLITVAGIFLVLGFLTDEWNQAIIYQLVGILFVGLISITEYNIPAVRKRISNAKKRKKRKRKK